jgi:hypothetical protein
LFEVKIKNKPNIFFLKSFSDELGGVEILCNFGAVYVGQTERSVGTRHKEHEADLRLARTDLEERRDEVAQRRMNRSNQAKHCIEECGRTPDWDGVKVVGQENGWMSRRLRETLQTAKRQFEGKPTINETDVN